MLLKQILIDLDTVLNAIKLNVFQLSICINIRVLYIEL